VRDQVSHPYKTTGKIIVLYILIFSVNLIHLAQDMDQWRALVKTVMDLRVLRKARNLTS
jgi:hypothetical protein